MTDTKKRCERHHPEYCLGGGFSQRFGSCCMCNIQDDVGNKAVEYEYALEVIAYILSEIEGATPNNKIMGLVRDAKNKINRVAEGFVI